MREIWMMQPRFERRVGNGPFTLVEQPRFRAGFDFLRLRADAGETDGTLAEWWEDFSMGDDEERSALMEVAREQDHARRASSGSQAHASKGARSGAESGAGESDPARKRRRRRRKPGASSQGGSSGAGP